MDLLHLTCLIIFPSATKLVLIFEIGLIVHHSSQTERYENSFYPYAIKRWNELGEDPKFKPSVQSFKKHLYDFARPLGHSLFGIRDQYGIKQLTKIRVSFPDLRDHRFNHNFNCDNPLCSRGIEDETSVHFFIRCPHYITLRSILLSKISDIICSDVTPYFTVWK